MIRLEKEIVIKDDKRYTNYILIGKVNNKEYRIGIMPKTYGREWTHPQVRQSFTILDILSGEAVVKDLNKEAETESAF